MEDLFISCQNMFLASTIFLCILAELQHFMGNLGMFLDDATMTGLMDMYDDDGNGRITFDEFQGNDDVSQVIL